MIVKSTVGRSGASQVDVETALQQLVSKALVAEGVIDVFEAAGLKKPDVSVLSEDFLTEVKAMPHKNLAAEMLRRLLVVDLRHGCAGRALPPPTLAPRPRGRRARVLRSGMTRMEFDPDGAALPDGGIYGLPHTADEAKVILIPVPWDATTSYRRGAADGPAAILAASGQIDLFDVEVGTPYRAGIAMLPESAELRMWNALARAAADPVIANAGRFAGEPALERAVAEVNELSARVDGWVRAETERWLAAGKLVGVVGGDHASPFGAIEAVARRHPGLGVLHVDAHADLRAAYEGFTGSHASIMHNVLHRIPAVGKLVQVGIRDLAEAEHRLMQVSGERVSVHFDAVMRGELLAGGTWAARCARIVDELPADVYVSFDIDGLDPTLCPHTGTPVPGGLSFTEATYLVGAVARSGRRIVGFDLNEVAPGPDGDEWDANVGMRLLYKLIGWALISAPRS
jgi:agmatinase